MIPIQVPNAGDIVLFYENFGVSQILSVQVRYHIETN
jgi:hypothetical protein